MVYRDANGHIDELYFVAAAGRWGSADLTALSGGSLAVGTPIAYVTDFPPLGPTARLNYLGRDSHVHELYYLSW